MKLNKANTAGLASPLQQSEMRSILAGAWPPLKPLPVFKYETAEYRATIDFDKKRGEWVCRRTALPSNEVQELRGGLREITMALPHAEAEIFSEGADPQEQELEKDKNRRLQAIHDWREKYESGTRYFELRDYLSESQRSELDASLRLSLTARQLQFNAKNVASVFDDLAIAGGRFATLIEFAKRNQAKQVIEPQTTGPHLQVSPVQGEEVVVDAEPAADHEKNSVGISSAEFGDALNNDNPLVQERDAEECCADADELPALSVKNVSPEQEQAFLAERIADIPRQQLEIETAEPVDAALLAEHPDQEGRRTFASSGPARKLGTGQSSPGRSKGSSRFPAPEISALQVAVLSLFAMLAFSVGLRAGRGSLGKPVREASKSMLASETKSATPLDQKAVSASRSSAPPMGDSPATKKLAGQGPEQFAEVRSGGSDSRLTTGSEPSATAEVDSARDDAIGLRSHAPYRLTTTTGAAPHVAKPSAILVSVPSQGQPFRVSSPIKAIAATSSFAMVSQLSFLVSPAAEPAVAHQSAQLEAGELVSFVWPRYPRPGTIRVRATIGQLGQVQEVKFLSGSGSLLPATVRAVRQWRYRPTLLDKSPVQTQQDVTIEFRPRQYSPRMSTRRSIHNKN